MVDKDSVVLSTRVPRQLAERFAQKIERRGYMNVSDALRDLIRGFVEEEVRRDGSA